VLAKFLEEFDQDLGRLIAQLPKDVNVVVMGDHGMSAIQYEINARKLLPEGVSKYFQIRTSGGSLLLYPNGALDMAVPQGLDLSVVAEHLRNQVVEFDGGRKVFKSVVIRDDASARAIGLNGSMSPWISAFAEEGIAVQDRLENPYLVSRRESFMIPEALKAKYPDPMNSGSLMQPTPLGAHGHDSTLDSMKTHFFATGRDLRDLARDSLPKYNLEVVPFVAKNLGWPTLDTCVE
jgi:predicted AlkP superfamily pyrophosphatase or phosphodiesterase